MRKSFTAILKSSLTSVASRNDRLDYFRKLASQLRSAVLEEQFQCTGIEFYMDAGWRFEVLSREPTGPKLECVVAWIFGTDLDCDTSVTLSVVPSWESMSQPESRQLLALCAAIDRALRKLNIPGLNWAQDESPKYCDRSRWCHQFESI